MGTVARALGGLTPAPRRGPRPGPAALFATFGLAAVLPAQQPGGVHLRGWTGELGLESELRDEKSGTEDAVAIRQREWLLRESIGLRAHGDVYAPALLDLDLGIRTDFDQRELQTDPGSTEQYTTSTNLYYDGMAWILKEKPLNADVYARRGRLDTRQRFFPTTTADTEIEGFNVRYRDLWIPSALHYEQSEYVGRGLDTMRQSTERWKLDGSRREETTTFDYGLERNHIDQESYDLEYDESLAHATFGYGFGREKTDSFTANANYREQTGDQNSLFEQASGSLHLQWLPELSSDHGVAVDHSEVGNGGDTSNRDSVNATSSLTHRLYESLETTLGGRYYDVGYDVGGLQRIEGSLVLDYTKLTPFGSLGIGYAPMVYREKEEGGGQVPVLGEAYTYSPGVPIILASDNVVTDSVVVRNAISGTIYQQPGDYVLLPMGAQLRLDIPVGSLIVAGTNLLVDYSYEPTPGRTYEGVARPVSLTLNFGNYASLALEHSVDRAWVTEGIDDGTIGNTRRDAARGWVGQWGQSLSMEYEDFDSFVTSTERIRTFAMSRIELDSDKTLNTTANVYKTRFKEQDTRERGITLASDLQWRVSQPMTAYARVEYHRIDYTADFGTGYMFEAGFDFRLNRNSITLDARYAVEEFDIASDLDLVYVHLTFRRIF